MSPLIAMPFPLTLGMPGGGTFDCIRLCEALAQAGARVILMPVASTGPFRFPRPAPSAERDGADVARSLMSAGVEVRPLPRHPLHYLLDGRVVKRAVKELLDEHPIDLVCGWGYESAFLEPLLRRRGVPFAMNAAASYGPLFRPGGRPLSGRHAWQAERLHARPFRMADRVFARSEFTRGEMIEYAGVAADRVQVLYIAPEARFLEIERAERDGPGSREPVERFLYMGGFVRDKGFFDCLQAFGRLARVEERPWTLRLVGWGDPDLARKLAADEGIEARVEVRGAVDREGLPAELAWAQLACLPSYTESFGLTVAEAQASGLPVVAYAAGAVPEVVQDGETAWLAPRGDVLQLTERLVQAARDPEETSRRGRAGRKRMQESFTWERTAQAFLAGIPR